MALFNRKSSGGGKGSGKPSRKDTKSIFGLKVLGRVQALLSTADAVVASLPPSEEDNEGGRKGRGRTYGRALINPAGPARPTLKVIGLRRAGNETVFTIGIMTRRGMLEDSFSETVELTALNAAASAKTLTGTLLKDPGALSTVTRALTELAAAPEGTQRAFSIGAGNRLVIESGEGGR